MKRLSVSSKPIARLISCVLSIPLFFKIMGIGLVVAAVFGGVMLLQVRSSVSRTLHQMLEERTRSIARSLVASLERPMSTSDVLAVDQSLQRTRQMFPDVRYIIVRAVDRRIVSHTFEHSVPHDLLNGSPDPAARSRNSRSLPARRALSSTSRTRFWKVTPACFRLGLWTRWSPRN